MRQAWCGVARALGPLLALAPPSHLRMPARGWVGNCARGGGAGRGEGEPHLAGHTEATRGGECPNRAATGHKNAERGPVEVSRRLDTCAKKRRVSSRKWRNRARPRAWHAAVRRLAGSSRALGWWCWRAPRCCARTGPARGAPRHQQRAAGARCRPRRHAGWRRDGPQRPAASPAAEGQRLAPRAGASSMVLRPGANGFRRKGVCPRKVGIPQCPKSTLSVIN